MTKRRKFSPEFKREAVKLTQQPQKGAVLNRNTAPFGVFWEASGWAGGSRWIVIDTEYLRQQVAHYALLSADTWRQRLLDAGVEVD